MRLIDNNRLFSEDLKDTLKSNAELKIATLRKLAQQIQQTQYAKPLTQ